MNREYFQKIVKQSVSKSEVCRILGWHPNGHSFQKIIRFAQEFDIDLSHFSQKAVVDKFQRKWPIVTKTCPVCNKEFETQKGDPREKTTCSHSCSNTWFRKRRNKPEHYGYRRKCFERWGKRCLVCGYDRFVHAHHIDGNHSNDDIENLIPLCGNHHEEIHSKRYYPEIAALLLKQYNVITSPIYKGSNHGM